jgi:hypothetical protein
MEGSPLARAKLTFPFAAARQAYEVAEKHCCPWFDKLTTRVKPLKSLDLILSLSKDGAWIPAFSAANYRG